MSEQLAGAGQDSVRLRQALDLAIEIGEKLQAKLDRYEAGVYVVALNNDDEPDGLFGPYGDEEAVRLASEYVTDHGGTTHVIRATTL